LAASPRISLLLRTSARKGYVRAIDSETMAPLDVPESAGLPPPVVRPEPTLGEELARRIALLPRERAVTVTELLEPRLAFYRGQQPVPITPEREARMTEGRERHEKVERLLTAPIHREVRVARSGVVGRIDLFDDVPTEIKATGDLPEIGRLPESRPQFIEQLGMYCGLVDRPEGRLILIGMEESGPPGLLVADCRFRDLEEVRRRMFSRAERLRAALRGGRAEALPRCSWFGRGCEFQRAGTCTCTGDEPEEPLPIRPSLVSIRPAPGFAESLLERWVADTASTSRFRLLRYSELLYPRRAFFARSPSPLLREEVETGPRAAQPRADAPSLYQRLTEGMEEGEVGELIRQVAAGDAPEELVSLFRGDPVVLKTSRSRYPPSASELAVRQPHYLAELGVRCASFRRTRGWLIIGYEQLLPGEHPIRAYRVEFETLLPWERLLAERTAMLRKAFRSGTPDGLPPCPDWMFEKCPYRSVCGEAPGLPKSLGP
jgi:hypothetical protein